MENQNTAQHVWAIVFLGAVLVAALSTVAVLVVLSPLAGALPFARHGVWPPQGPLAVGGLALLGTMALGWTGMLRRR